MFDVVTIGAVTRDIFISSRFFKTVRDPRHLEKIGFKTGEAQCVPLGGKIEITQPVETIGGGAANAAVTFSRQGFRVGALVKISRDSNGRAAEADLRREKVKPILLFDKKVGTAYSVILLSPDGERTILNFRGASEDMKINELPLSKLKAKWAYISTGHLHPEILYKVLKRLEKNRTFVAMNPSKYYIEMGVKRLAPILNKLDVMILNREEAAYLTSLEYHQEEKIFKKLNQLMKGADVGTLTVMTDGPAGVLVSDGRKIYQAGIYKEKAIVDRTGAGDAFGSGFMAALIGAAEGKSSVKDMRFAPKEIEFAIKLGSANATSVVEHIGAQVGILRKPDFRKQTRFKHLAIKIKHLA